MLVVVGRMPSSGKTRSEDPRSEETRGALVVFKYFIMYCSFFKDA